MRWQRPAALWYDGAQFECGFKPCRDSWQVIEVYIQQLLLALKR